MVTASKRHHLLILSHLVWNWYAALYVSVAHRLNYFLLGIIVDDTKGNSSTETVWDDTDVAKLDTIADTQLHRNVDILILAADKEGESCTHPTLPPPRHDAPTYPQSQGYVKTYFVIPSTIFGFASGKLVDLGVQNTRSIQIPWAVSRSISRKRAGHVGQGLSVWPDVHIDDSEFHVYSVLGLDKAHLRDDDHQSRISTLSCMTPSWKERRAMVARGSTLARTVTTCLETYPPRSEKRFMI